MVSESTSEEDLTTEYDDANSSAEEDDSEELEIEKETRAIEEAVSEDSESLDNALSEDLDEALRAAFVTATTTARNNPGEAFKEGTPSPRLAAITTRLNETMKVVGGKGYDPGDGYITFLESVLEYDVPGEDADVRREEATRLAHALVTAVNNPAQAGDLDTLVTQMAAQDDPDYWLQLADDFDGTPVPTSRLVDHVLMMGLTIEMKPSGNYLWHNADQKAMFVDDLIGASGSGPRVDGAITEIDVSNIYRRAASLTFNGQPIPRPIVAELVRMALTEIYQGVQPGRAPLDVPPTRESLKTYLRAETIQSDATPTEQAAAEARNAVRAAGLALAEMTSGSRAETASAKSSGSAFRVAARSGRGDLSTLFDFMVASSRNATRALEGGKPMAKTVQSAIEASGVREAISAWDTLYKAGETDPLKLRPALDLIRGRLSDLATALNKALPDPMSNPAASSGLSIVVSLGSIAVEIGAEAGELLEGHQSVSNPLEAAHALVDEMTAQARSRSEALAARDRAIGKGGKLSGGLDNFLAEKLRLFSGKTWCADLRQAAGDWSTASTHDYLALSQATTNLLPRLEAANKALDALPGAPNSNEYLAGRAALDALAFAVRDRLMTLAAIDPQTSKLNHFDTLANGVDAAGKPSGLNAWLDPVDPPADVAKYWAKQKSAVKDAPTGGGFGKALRSWQKAASATSLDPRDLATKTFRVIEILADYRRQVTTSGRKPSDTASALRILDMIAMGIAAGTAPR